MARLRDYYRTEVVPALMDRLGYDNVMEVPRVLKIVVNMGVGEAKDNPKALEGASADMAIVTGQRPAVTRARKSVAAFKVREGMAVGCKVTLRGRRMWHFLDRLVNIALPRVRDFRGVSADAFDGRGGYSLGLREQLVFPEINYDDIDQIRGMDIAIATSAKTDEEARELLAALGMPFKREEE